MDRDLIAWALLAVGLLITADAVRRLAGNAAGIAALVAELAWTMAIIGRGVSRGEAILVLLLAVLVRAGVRLALAGKRGMAFALALLGALLIGDLAHETGKGFSTAAQPLALQIVSLCAAAFSAWWLATAIRNRQGSVAIATGLPLA